MKGERVNIEEAIWNIGMELVWLYQSEPGTRLIGESSLVIEEESSGNNWISVVNARIVEPVIALFMTASAYSPHDFHDRMIEVQVT